MSGPPTPSASGKLPGESPGKEAVAEFARLATEHRIRVALEALEHNGITTHFVDADEQARDIVRSILPLGAEVYNNTSRTLEVIGVWFDEPEWRPVLFYSGCRPATFKVRLSMAAPLRLAAHRRQATGSES